VPEFRAKYKSKREVYNLLAVEAKKYLPPVANVTIYFLKECASGIKRRKFRLQSFTLPYLVLSNEQLRHLSVPNYDTLSLKIILAFARQHREVMHHLPVEREIEKLPK